MIESLKQQRERLLALRDRASHSMKVREINEKHPNEAFVDIPYGYIEIGGSRSRREANAEFIASTHELAQCLEAHAKALEDAYSMLAAALPHLETVQDEGPGSEGWQSDKLSKLCCGIDAAIAASKHEG